MVMAFIVIIKQIDPLFGCNFSFENYIVSIKTSIDNYFVLCKVILELLDFGVPPPLCKSIPVVSNKRCTTGRILLP